MAKRRWISRLAITLAVVFVGAAGLVEFAYLRPLTVLNLYTRWLLWRGGVESHYLQVTTRQASFRVHYYAGGAGRPVVLIHGLASSAESWTGVFGPLMRAGFRVYALDLAGSKNSDAPDIDYSIATQAEIVQACLQALGLKRVDLGGVSMGGWIAMAFTVAHPEAVSQLFLIDTAGTAFEPAFQPSLFLPGNPDDLQTLLDRLSPQPGPVPLFIRRDFLRQLTARRWVIRREVVSMFSRRELMDQQLSKMHIPVLILWGERDRLIPLAVGRALQEQIAGSQLEVLPGCGHTVLEVCSKQLAPKLVSFLR